jgi:glycyl-tRNA synthetase
MILCDSYRESEGRIYLDLKPSVAPYKAAIFPLVANKPELVERARQLHQTLSKDMPIAWDDRGNIGKRYAAQDEIGTPFCITIDYNTLEDNTVTVRSRNDASQVRVSIDTIKEYLLPFLN